jgi:hypothetical protein
MIRFDYLHDPLPKPVDTLRSIRLPQHLYVVTAAGASVVCALAIAWGVATVRVHAAQTLERTAQARFERSRTALSALRLQWQHLDELVAQDRRLRELRVSGSLAAARVAHVGNAFPRGSWLTSMTASSSEYALKGYSGDLSTLEVIVTNLVNDPTVGRPKGIRLSRDDRGRAGLLGFEVRLDPAP